MIGLEHPKKIHTKPKEITQNDDLKILNKMLKEVEDEKSIEEIQEAINLNEKLQSMTIPQLDIVRKKRQVTSVNCKECDDQLGVIEDLIIELLQNITITTETLDYLNQKISIYGAPSSGTSKTLYDILKNIANTTTAQINLLEYQLTVLQDQQIQTKSDFHTYCSHIGATETPTSE